jgi:cell division protein FtsX
MIEKVGMKVRYNGFTYTVGEGFRNIFKNTKSSITSILTMICMMFLFGISFAIGVNVNSILEQVQMKQGMEVFIWDEVTQEQKDRFEQEIKALDGVNKVTYKNKQQALESMKERMPGNSDLWAGYEGENNIFPASYVVTLTDLSLSEDVESAIASMEGVKRITSSNDTITTLLKIANGVKIAIGVIFIILLFIAITIIFHKDLLAVTIIYCAFSFGAMMLYIIVGAADVAFTEAVIGVVSTVYFIIAIKSISRRCK